MNASLLTGLVCGAIAGFGVVLLHIVPKYRWLVAILLLLLLTPVAMAGFWFSPGDWGISDWDYYFSLHTNWRNTILHYHQLPLWNPYVCGGTAGLGDPEFSVLTPSYLFELIFGIPTGLRLAIYFVTFMGATGMLMLARRLKLSPSAGFLVGIIYAFGSVNLLEIVEGHPNIFSAAWIPWVFWSWLSAYRSPQRLLNRYTIWLSIFLALTFYQGGIYLLMYTALAFIVLPWFTRQPWRAYKLTAVAGVIALGISAFKLIPVIYWLKEFQDQAYASSTLTLPWLYQILAGRYLHGAEVIPNQGGGWHEYGAYVGLPVLLLAFWGAFDFLKKRTVRGLVIAAILALLVSSLGPVLKPIFDHLDFMPRSNISRFILFAVIPLSLLAGYSVSRVDRRWPKVAVWLLPVIVAVVALDVTSLAFDLSEQAFILPAVVSNMAPAPSPIAFTTKDFKIQEPKNATSTEYYTRAYADTLAGYGTMTYCSVLSPLPAVHLITDPGGDQPLDVSDPKATFHLDSWSPNHIRVTVNTPTSSQVILNTNYAKGWIVNGQPAKEMGNRVGVLVPAGTISLDFHYQPPGFTAGIIITVLTLLSGLMAIVYVQAHKLK